jgi:malonate decarboxylase epsilon subunit
MSLGLVFPGQGSQRAGMLHSLLGSSESEPVLTSAERVLGYDPLARDNETSLRSTVNAQLGLFICGVISARVLAARGIAPHVVAGHSVGAFAAAVAGEALAFERALRAVRVRAQTMERLFSSGYGMGVCVGLPVATVRDVVARAQRDGAAVYVANVNAAAQVAISGTLEGVRMVLDAARTRAARRADLLAVSVPSHCELLAPVATAVREELADAAIAMPSCALICGSTGRGAGSADEIRDDLCDGVAREVRWYDCAQLIVELGTRLVVEAVPSHVLTDLFDGGRIRAVALDGTRADTIATLAARLR